MSENPPNSPEPPKSVPSLLARLDVMVSLIVAGLLFLIVGEAQSPNGEREHETIEWIGLVLIVIAIFGRTWCAIYLGNEARKVLVAQGPYSVCRNPHYGFTILGAVGVGAQVGSATVAIVCGALAWIVVQRVALQEEAQLLALHGEAYARYCERVPRFIPKISLWRDVEMTEVWPQTVAATFLESVIFLLAIPVAEGIEYLHDIQVLPVLVRLP